MCSSRSLIWQSMKLRRSIHSLLNSQCKVNFQDVSGMIGNFHTSYFTLLILSFGFLLIFCFAPSSYFLWLAIRAYCWNVPLNQIKLWKDRCSLWIHVLFLRNISTTIWIKLKHKFIESICLFRVYCNKQSHVCECLSNWQKVCICKCVTVYCPKTLKKLLLSVNLCL